MRIKAYITHKLAEKYCDCQDCFGVDPQNNRIAISDGISQSIFPYWWAEILVNFYLREGYIPEDEDFAACQDEWFNRLSNEIAVREKEGKNPWRLKNSVAERSGAGATLCGVEFGPNYWRCSCIGDSCMILVNNDFSLEFVTSQTNEFGNHPDYLDSFKKGRGTPVVREGNFENRYAIILATDPFCELFKKYEKQKGSIQWLIWDIKDLSDHNSFVDLVKRWRNKFGMHNDDSTLIYVDELNNPKWDEPQCDNLETLRTEEVKSKH